MSALVDSRKWRDADPALRLQDLFPFELGVVEFGIEAVLGEQLGMLALCFHPSLVTAIGRGKGRVNQDHI
jgi:hypothetical protein